MTPNAGTPGSVKSEEVINSDFTQYHKRKVRIIEERFHSLTLITTFCKNCNSSNHQIFIHNILLIIH